MKQVMNRKEFSELRKKLEKYKEKVSSSKTSSRKFLLELGVATKTGKLTKAYK